MLSLTNPSAFLRGVAGPLGSAAASMTCVRSGEPRAGRHRAGPPDGSIGCYCALMTLLKTSLPSLTVFAP